MKTSEISLGEFRNAISEMKAPYITRDEPLEPLSILMPVDGIHVVLGAASCIALRSGRAYICLSHIQAIKRSMKRGRQSYLIVCGDYTDSNIPRPVEYRLFTGN